MTRWQAITAATALALFGSGSVPIAHASAQDPAGDPRFEGNSGAGDALHVGGSMWTGGGKTPVATGTSARRETRSVDCLNDPTFDECPSSGNQIFVCASGLDPTWPVFERWVTNVGTATPWQLLTWYGCPQTAAEPDIDLLVLNAWTQLDPGIPPLTIQPDQDWVYSTVPTVAYVDPTPVTHDDNLLGIPVQIRATPSQYTWTWGDGETTTTTDPGKPYPNQTVDHTYLHVQGDVDVTLTTTWDGDYSINGGPWIDIAGTLTTTSAPRTFTVYSPHSHLVNCDLNGNCTD